MIAETEPQPLLGLDKLDLSTIGIGVSDVVVSTAIQTLLFLVQSELRAGRIVRAVDALLFAQALEGLENMLETAVDLNAFDVRPEYYEWLRLPPLLELLHLALNDKTLMDTEIIMLNGYGYLHEFVQKFVEDASKIEESAVATMFHNI